MRRDRKPLPRETKEKNQRWFVFWSHLQVLNVDGVLKDVGCVGAHGDTSAGRQVSTEPAHRLHHKHSPLGPRGRLLDLVATLRKKATMAA